MENHAQFHDGGVVAAHDAGPRVHLCDFGRPESRSCRNVQHPGSGARRTQNLVHRSQERIPQEEAE
jgi:hypothetical protein